MTSLALAVEAVPVVAVIRHDDTGVAERIADAAVAGGVRAVEVTFTVPSAGRLIAALRDRHPGVAVGAGTVLTPVQLDEAADAGADFAVSPVFDPGVAERSAARGLALIPGAMTPTEVAVAAAGSPAPVVKIFPAGVVGPAFVSALRDVMPEVRLMPTGGIAADAVGAWLSAGAYAVGLAGALGSAWRAGTEDAVRQTTRIAVAAATAERSPS